MDSHLYLLNNKVGYVLPCMFDSLLADVNDSPSLWLWVTDHVAILFSCTFLYGIKLLVCHHPDLRLPPIPCIPLSMLHHVIDWGWLFRNDSTEQRTFQPVALSTVAVPQHAASCTLYTHHYPLPIEVNTDVILSLFHWSLAPHGAVGLAFSLKVNLIWSTPALALARLPVLRFCLYWLLWNEITLHCKEGLLVGHS